MPSIAARRRFSSSSSLEGVVGVLLSSNTASPRGEWVFHLGAEEKEGEGGKGDKGEMPGWLIRLGTPLW